MKATAEAGFIEHSLVGQDTKMIAVRNVLLAQVSKFAAYLIDAHLPG